MTCTSAQYERSGSNQLRISPNQKKIVLKLCHLNKEAKRKEEYSKQSCYQTSGYKYTWKKPPCNLDQSFFEGIVACMNNVRMYAHTIHD